MTEAKAVGERDDVGQGPTLCLSGGDVQCPNLGVVALGLGSITGIRGAMPGARVVVHTFEPEERVRVKLAEGEVTLETVSIWFDSSLLKPAEVRHLRLAGQVVRRIGRWAAGYNKSLGTLLDCDAMLDISGGDSFADIYGQRRFEAEAAKKLLARDLGKPLILLPQTYGPFTKPRSIEVAREILRSSVLAATREVHGVEELAKVLGAEAAERVVSCPDVAFLLEPIATEAGREPVVEERGGGRPLIGLNISGLLYFSQGQFGVAGSYAKLVEAITEWAVEQVGARVVLVPHVLNWPTHSLEYEREMLGKGQEGSDSLACAVVEEAWRGKYGGRVRKLSGRYGPAETKYLAGQCDFFIGARMHACIGASAQGAPTVTLAYSKKAAGVMGHLDMRETVVDLRELSIEDCVGRIDRLYGKRQELRARLVEAVPGVKGKVRAFFEGALAKAVRGE